MVERWRREPEAHDYPAGLARLRRRPPLYGVGALPALPALWI